MGLLEDVATFLEAAELGERGTNLFLNMLPDTPANAIGLYETSGRIADRTHTGSRYDFPRFQVLVRDEVSPTGRARIEALYEAMASVTNQLLGDRPYLYLRPQQPPFFLRRDENDRPIFAFNVEAHTGFAGG